MTFLGKVTSYYDKQVRIFPIILFGGCLLARTFPHRGENGQLERWEKTVSAVPPDGFQFEGTWDCSGAFRNNKVHKATFTGATIVGGKWPELAEQDVEPATGYLAKYLIGYDSPAHARVVEFDASNLGGAMYTSQEGWQNRALIMTSAISEDSQALYAVNRFRYTVTGPNTFTSDWEISKTANLNWVAADHLACARR